MGKKQKRYNAKEKVGIIRKHLLEGEPVSEVCEEYGIQPSVYYRWQKAFFEQGSQVFERGRDSQVNRQQQQIEALEEKLRDTLLPKLISGQVRVGEMNISSQRDPTGLPLAGG